MPISWAVSVLPASWGRVLLLDQGRKLGEVPCVDSQSHLWNAAFVLETMTLGIITEICLIYS